MHALALLLAALQAPPAPPIVDLEALLAERRDPAALARLPAPPYRLRAASAAAVDLAGPGAIVRIEARGGTIRVRLDGAEEPVLVAGPDAAILDRPIPVAKSCRVASEGGEPCLVEYRAYPAGTAVRSAARDALARAADEPDGELGGEPAGADTFTFSLSEEIPEGGLTCLDPEAARGPRAVTRIHLRAEASDLRSALRRALLRLAFDGETTVACPLGDFFGCAPDPEAREGARLSVAPGIDEATGRPGTQVELVCRFVMPYRERFDLAIDARGAGDLHVAGLVRTAPWTWNERSLRFHAAWTPAASRLHVDGRGLLAGEILALGSAGGETSGGLVRVRADEETPLEALRLPDSAVAGWRAARRFRALDAVPFEARAELATSLERAGEREVRAAATVYYSALPGARDDAPAIRAEDRAIPRLAEPR
jgi:hypothetical protein